MVNTPVTGCPSWGRVEGLHDDEDDDCHNKLSENEL